MTRFGFHTVHFSPMFGNAVPALEVIELTAAAGFDAIGLDLASVEASGSSADVGAAIRDHGLECSDVLVLLTGADDLHAAATSLARLAAATGAPVCIAAVPEPVPTDELVSSLTGCSEILADHGCRLAVEFTPYTALSTLAEAIALCDLVGVERCGLVLDPIHFFRSGSPWEVLDTVTAEQIAIVQWDDAPAVAPPATCAELARESRTRRLLPGAGGLPLTDLAAAIRATGWDGIVSAEVLSDDLRNADPAVVITETRAALASSGAGWC